MEVRRGVGVGEVADESVCAACHADIAASYREVAMARSTSKPGDPRFESGTQTFRHVASGRVYQLEQRGEVVSFRRWIEGAAGQRRFELELPIDFVIGSGEHARSYVVRTKSDELFLLPVTWYADIGLAMSPGFDRRDHRGVLRQVRRDCLVCHAATPDLPAGGDLPRAPERFPAELPAIGCQRCHGAGAEHARLAFEGDRDGARRALVDLGALPAERQLALCESCHLQPSVALAATRRFDHGEYGFVPGMALGEFRVVAEVHEPGRDRAEVFEINHHAWRLRQSPCFLASGGRPICTGCHDPHRRERGAALADRVRSTCLECHSSQACGEPAGRLADADCASCHLGKRRPEDVVHVVMTDHRISRFPPAGALEPRRERELEIDALSFPAWGGRPEGAEGAAFLAVSALRTTGYRNDSAREQLRQAVAGIEQPPRETLLELGRAELAAQERERAGDAVSALLGRDPDDPAALELEGLVALTAGEAISARDRFKRVLEADPRRPEVWQALGEAERLGGDLVAATKAFEQAVAWRELFPSAWVQLGTARLATGELEAAADAFSRALLVEPSTTGAWLGLARINELSGRRDEARQWLEDGVLLVDESGAGLILAALHQLEVQGARSPDGSER